MLTGETLTEEQIYDFKLQLEARAERGVDTYTDRWAHSLCIKAAVPRLVMPMLSDKDHAETTLARTAVAVIINTRNESKNMNETENTSIETVVTTTPTGFVGSSSPGVDNDGWIQVASEEISVLADGWLVTLTDVNPGPGHTRWWLPDGTTLAHAVDRVVKACIRDGSFEWDVDFANEVEMSSGPGRWVQVTVEQEPDPVSDRLVTTVRYALELLRETWTAHRSALESFNSFEEWVQCGADVDQISRDVDGEVSAAHASGVLHGACSALDCGIGELISSLGLAGMLEEA